MTFWEGFFGALSAGGVLVGLLVFFGKTLVGQLLKKDLELFKAQLQTGAKEHSVVFETLHTQRANVIAETYGLIAQLTQALNLIVQQVEKDNKYEKVPSTDASRVYEKLLRYHSANRIWLSAELAKKLDLLLDQSKMALIEAEFVEPELYLVENELEPYVSQLTYLGQELEDEFRAILGTEGNATSG